MVFGFSDGLIVLLGPVFLLTGFTYTRIETVGRVEFAVELFERRFGLV